MNAGLNLYSIRNLIETEEAFLDTAKKLKDMGYSYLQYSGGVYDPDRISRVSKATGLPITLYLHADQGGAQQIGARLSYNEIDLVIFLCDPKNKNGFIVFIGCIDGRIFMSDLCMGWTEN